MLTSRCYARGLEQVWRRSQHVSKLPGGSAEKALLRKGQSRTRPRSQDVSKLPGGRANKVICCRGQSRARPRSAHAQL